MITATAQPQRALDASSREKTSHFTGLASSGFNFIPEGCLLTTVYPGLVVSNGRIGFRI